VIIINLKTIGVDRKSVSCRPSVFVRPSDVDAHRANGSPRFFACAADNVKQQSLSVALSSTTDHYVARTRSRPVRIAAPTDCENLPENRRPSVISVIYYRPVTYRVHRKRAASYDRRIIHHRFVLEIIQNSGPDEELRLFRPKRRRQDEHEEKKSRQHQQHRDEVRTRYYVVLSYTIMLF